MIIGAWASVVQERRAPIEGQKYQPYDFIPRIDISRELGLL